MYDEHAVRRLEERLLFPSVVEEVIRNGKKYTLKSSQDFGESKGGTHVYLGFNIANVINGTRIGERMIKVDPLIPKKDMHILVITGVGDIVKTVYLIEDKRLDSFFRKCV